MQKKFFRAMIALLALSVAPFAATAQSSSVRMPRFIEIGTAGTGGAYYPIGIAMAEILTAKLKTQATAQVTGGAVENIRLIQDGSVKIALTSTSSAFRGMKGLAPFTRPHDRVRGLFSNLTQGIYQIAAREGSGIKTLQDLRGKRVSLGPQGGLAVEMSNYVFQAAGFGINDIKATFLSYEESATMMGDGNLDAVVIQAAMPSPALVQLQSSGKRFAMISLPASVIAKVYADHPYFTSFKIPKATYNTPEDVTTLNSTNMAIVDRDMPEDVVYESLKALMADIDKIRASQPSARAFAIENAPQMPIPLHPGAEKFYRERNLLGR